MWSSSASNALLDTTVRIAVGTALAGGPPHRSQRAELPHWAPVSGTNVEARLGIGVQDTDGREPSGDEAVHPLPAEAVALAAAPERSEPVPADLDAEGVDGPNVAGHGVVGEMSSHHACQPPRLVGDGQMPAPLKLVFDLLELGPQPLRDGVTPQP